MPTDDTPAAFEVLSSTVQSANPWFRVLRSQVLTPTGRQLTYYSIDHARPAVGVVARRPGEVLLIRQYRFLVDELVWAIPSGGCEVGETTTLAAGRELTEETGQVAASLRPLQRYYPSYGASNQVFELFEADVEPGRALSWDPDEVLDVAWFAEAEVAAMARAGGIVDGLSLTPLLLLAGREGW